MTTELIHQRISKKLASFHLEASRTRDQRPVFFGKSSIAWTVALLFTLWTLGTSESALAQNISTAAGNGIAGYSGNGGPATSAEINYPGGVSSDLNGNVYIADTSNCVIREVSTSGIITNFAGNGICGYGGDYNVATDSELNYPEGVAVDGGGNVFIADSGNNRVREVSQNNIGQNIITTVAGNGTAGFSGDGGLAIDAELNYPIGVGVDLENNLYIADTGNNRVRYVPRLGTRTISEFAGNGSSTYSGDNGPATSAGINPVAVDVSPGGNMYIVDQANNRIRQVAGTTITTVVGSGVTSEYYCGGPAAGYQTSVPPLGANLACPSGVSFDSSGDMFIADSSNQIIREWPYGDADVIVFAGNGTAGYNGDGILATNAKLYDPDGVRVVHGGPNVNGVYISDQFNSRIRFVP